MAIKISSDSVIIQEEDVVRRINTPFKAAAEIPSEDITG